MDRVNLKYIINPLDEKETKALINFRLQQAGYNMSEPLFTDAAIRLIYQHTQGYPRQISMLCHDALEKLIMQDTKVVDELAIEEITAQEVS
jgi:type II secretory pathway predicted ATPase ExeA